MKRAQRRKLPISEKDLLFVCCCALHQGAVLSEYTRVRVPDDHAIADLAMYNYIEVMLILSVCLNLNFYKMLYY